MKREKNLKKCTEYGTVVIKGVRFHPVVRDEISEYPEKIKKDIGYLVYLLQVGETLTMPDSRPMNEIASGVSELRVKDESGQYRVFYYLKSELGILVFHSLKRRLGKLLILKRGWVKSVCKKC